MGEAFFASGRFGEFGGCYVPETLVSPLMELQQAYVNLRDDACFLAELEYLLKHYVGRPSPIYLAANLSSLTGGAKIYFKREDLNATGSHKINNTLGQILLAKRMGKQRVIAETGAGQHGVATATACALLGLPCEIYMGEEDVSRQALNVFRMRQLGATVHAVKSGSKTLKDAINEALRDWVANVDNTFYCFGTAAGPHPFPSLVRFFQSVIGREARLQFLDMTGQLPDYVVACVGGGSNAIGIFSGFMEDSCVKLIGVEAGGKGLDSDMHSASLTCGSPGVLHGAKTYLLQSKDGQIRPTHSIAAGLDYPGVGPELSSLKEAQRAKFVAMSDEQALAGFKTLARTEGILAALESCHAVAFALELSSNLPPESNVLVNLSGRGDKDVANLAGEVG